MDHSREKGEVAPRLKGPEEELEDEGLGRDARTEAAATRRGTAPCKGQ